MSVEDESNPPPEAEKKGEEVTAVVESTTTKEENEESRPAAAATVAVKTSDANKEEKDDDKEPPAIKEEESTATFEPVIQLEEVEVKSGEEEEEVLCSYRSKLFLFGETLLDKGTGKKTWKERGIGEARILRHRDHQRIRFLMRQEKTMKVIANHALDPRIKLESNAGSDRSWVWSCFDFSDGELEEKVFALRFSNSELAEEFKNKYQECQAEMARLLAGEDAPPAPAGGEEAAAEEEVATALDGLSTKDDE